MWSHKTLVLGPGRNTHGGITSVIRAHSQAPFWKRFNCVWVETYIDRGPLLKLFFFAGGFLRFVTNLPAAGLVHIHFSGPTSIRRKHVFFRIARLCRKKIILHFHGFSTEQTLLGPRRSLYEKMLREADAVIALSGYWKDQINNLIRDPDKIHIVYNPCDPVEPARRVKKHYEILYAGTLNERKGYADLILAFSMIAHKYPGWKIVFAGNGEIENARALSKKLNVSKQVEFKGWVAGRKKAVLFTRASIFCLPSYAEGFPMAILDAWAYGLPVITTPVGGLQDVLINGENALVYNPGDTESLACNIEKLITSEILRNRLCEASYEMKNGQFNINSISDRLNDIYTGLATAEARSGRVTPCAVK
jgi:glycosyltransferase involved in cell wall biosynthesis